MCKMKQNTKTCAICIILLTVMFMLTGGCYNKHWGETESYFYGTWFIDFDDKPRIDFSIVDMEFVEGVSLTLMSNGLFTASNWTPYYPSGSKKGVQDYLAGEWSFRYDSTNRYASIELYADPYTNSNNKLFYGIRDQVLWLPRKGRRLRFTPRPEYSRYIFLIQKEDQSGSGLKTNQGKTSR